MTNSPNTGRFMNSFFFIKKTEWTSITMTAYVSMSELTLPWRPMCDYVDSATGAVHWFVLFTSYIPKIKT